MSADEYAVGDRVEVWDGDVGRWVPGVIDGVGTLGNLGAVWSVKTDTTFEGLPLTYGVPWSAPHAMRHA